MQGIPTTRAGSVVTSDSRVTRDMFYSGNPQQERCSVVMRVAPTFLRFGSFEIFKPTDSTTGEAIRTLRKRCNVTCIVCLSSNQAGIKQWLVADMSKCKIVHAVRIGAYTMQNVEHLRRNVPHMGFNHHCLVRVQMS